jgi:two-component system invasion response regulator UvrY
MIRVLIADDHPLVRAGLRNVLLSETDMSVVGEAGDVNELLQLVKKEHLDVILLDISMPGKSGLDVLRELKHDQPKLPVLVFSMHPEDRYAIRALRGGAAGYMTKESPPHELVRAIRKVASGGKYISPFLAEKLAYGLEMGHDRPPHEMLSDREFQVMCMIASGKTISDIAAELSLSISTVNTYRSRILDKMEMHSNAELTRYAIQNHLIE